ncbi:chitosanase [Powellomyces hirtus]|uniref:Chitosanase n=1 Tax=Powellomyces hirtus TaxID=109895 RepID=A0A507EBT5_9FUNG|nr:chitosanase [Powellomyces hirtus]
MHGPTFLSAALLAATAFLSTPTLAALTDCQKSMVQQLTNTFENSQTHFAFDYCQDIKDGRGFTCGIVGFTTSTRDAFDVVSTYSKDPGYSQEFEPYLGKLLELNSTQSDSAEGLSGFCDAWYTAASNPAFRAVQVAKADALYYTPAQKIADNLGLTLAISRGQLYDAAIQMGIESDPDSMPSIVNRTAKPEGMAEETWISNFMKERQRTLCNPSTPATQAAWCASVTRVESYTHLLETGQTNFTETFKPLNNDGKEFTINCNLDVWTQYIPGKRYGEEGGSGGLSTGAVAAIAVVLALLVLVGAFFVHRRIRHGTWRPFGKRSMVIV